MSELELFTEQKIQVPRSWAVHVPISIGFDATKLQFSCVMRATEDPESTLMAVWNVAYVTDGKDGEIEIWLPAAVTASLTLGVAWLFLYVTQGSLAQGSDTQMIFVNPLAVLVYD